MPKTTKKAKEKAIKLNKLKFELGLLLPSFSLMFSQYQAVIGEKESEEHEDLVLTKKLTQGISFAIKPYRKLHKEVSKIVVDIMQTEEQSKTNVFLVGLSLFGFYLELQEKIIKIKGHDELNTLYDLLCADADKEIVDRSNMYAESVLKKLKIQYGV
ncbi:MAG: hypothetical protein WC656_01475 [Sulfurimonas sp.]|jgi:hypothetical protein